MAYSRLLLLLIGMISTHLPEIHTRPIDFWCQYELRKTMMEMTAETADCGGSDELPSPMQIPDVGLRIAEWKNKTLPQKHAEVLEALQVFQDGMQSVRSQVTRDCHNTTLKGLERSIKNYLSIFKQPPIQTDDLIPHSAEKNCSSQTSLNNVLTQYRMLLSGKLESFVDDLQDTVCREKTKDNQ